MKNVEIWSRATDRNILTGLRWVGVLLLAAMVGYAYPTEPIYNLAPVDALITSLLLILVWGCFHVLQPSRPGPTWRILEGVGVPAVWMLLVAIFLLCVHVACGSGMEVFLAKYE
jgi:hypothetical protein